jgi:hypothetical protein
MTTISSRLHGLPRIISSLTTNVFWSDDCHFEDIEQIAIELKEKVSFPCFFTKTDNIGTVQNQSPGQYNHHY